MLACGDAQLGAPAGGPAPRPRRPPAAPRLLAHAAHWRCARALRQRHRAGRRSTVADGGAFHTAAGESIAKDMRKVNRMLAADPRALVLRVRADGRGASAGRCGRSQCGRPPRPRASHAGATGPREPRVAQPRAGAACSSARPRASPRCDWHGRRKLGPWLCQEPGPWLSQVLGPVLRQVLGSEPGPRRPPTSPGSRPWRRGRTSRPGAPVGGQTTLCTRCAAQDAAAPPCAPPARWPRRRGQSGGAVAGVAGARVLGGSFRIVFAFSRMRALSGRARVYAVSIAPCVVRIVIKVKKALPRRVRRERINNKMFCKPTCPAPLFLQARNERRLLKDVTTPPSYKDNPYTV